MRKLILILICGICITAFSAANCVADEAVDMAAAKESALEYYKAFLSVDMDAIKGMTTEHYWKQAARNGMAQAMETYPLSVAELHSTLTFEFVEVEAFYEGYDVYLSTVKPYEEYIYENIKDVVAEGDDAAMAEAIKKVLQNHAVPMERAKVEINVKQIDGVWKINEHTDFVGELIKK